VSDSASRGQRIVIAVAAALRFMSGILMGTAMAVYVGEVGSEFVVSMVLTAYFLGMTLFAPFWGALADVTGRRRTVIVVTGVLATLAVVPLALVGRAGPSLAVPFTSFVVDGVWIPVGLRAVYAAFAVGFAPVMLAIVSERGGAEGRGRSLGFFNSARAVGFSGGQLAVGALLGLLAPEGLYWGIAGVSLAATVAAAFVVDPNPGGRSDASLGDVLAEVRTRLLPAVEDRSHLRTNGLRWLYVALALRNMTVLGVMSLMPVYLTGPVAFSAVVMGAVLAINPAGQAIFMVLFGRVADAAGRKPLIVGGMAGSGVFGLLAGLASVPTGTVPRLAVSVLAFVTIAAAFSAMTTGALAFIGDVAPRNRESELMGLRSTAKGLGGITGPPLLGGVATVVGMQAAFLAGSVLAFSAAVVAWLALTESRPDAAAAGTASATADGD
jgi:MFS family permease